MTLAEHTHHSAQRHKKASVTEFFARSSENSVEDQLMEDGVFPSVLRVMSVPQIQQQIMRVDVETPVMLEQPIQ